MSSFGTLDGQPETSSEGEHLREKDEAVSEEVTKSHSKGILGDIS